MRTLPPPRLGRRRPGAARALARAALASWLLALGAASGQPRADVTLGVAGAPVAGAWNPVRVVVRDAPAASFRLELDAGGLDAGEVIQSFTATLPAAAGVQRLDVDVPLPDWRRASWRVEQGERVLASGTFGARERDPRPLVLVLSARPAAWRPAFASEARVVAAAAADLPATAAGWDGVEVLLLDGTVAAPTASTVVAAAAAGVRVLLPSGAPAGYAPLAGLVRAAPSVLGAGSVEVLATPAGRALPPPPAGAWSRETRSALVAAGLASLPTPGWPHLPRLWILAGATLYAATMWTLLRLGGPAGLASAATLLLAAGLVAPLAAPERPAPRSDDAVVLVGGDLGVRVPLAAQARLPAGDAEIAGLWAPDAARPVAWTPDVTRVPLPAGGRVRMAGAPEVVTIPDDVRAGGSASGAQVPEALAAVLAREGTARALRSAGAWWIVRGAPDAAVARSPR